MMPKGTAVHSSQGRNLPHLRAGAIGDHAHDRIEEATPSPTRETGFRPAPPSVQRCACRSPVAGPAWPGKRNSPPCRPGCSRTSQRRKVSRSLLPRLSPAYRAAITASPANSISCRSASREELPIINSKSPGSTTYFMFTSKKESRAGVMSNVTVVVSPGSQPHLAEALQLLHRTRHRTDQIANVELHHFSSSALSGVRDIHQNLCRAVAYGSSSL